MSLHIMPHDTAWLMAITEIEINTATSLCTAGLDSFIELRVKTNKSRIVPTTHPIAPYTSMQNGSEGAENAEPINTAMEHVAINFVFILNPLNHNVFLSLFKRLYPTF
jgi:hypothetical protein